MACRNHYDKKTNRKERKAREVKKGFSLRS